MTTNRTGGFTLLELLVAAALTALIVTMAAGGLRFGAQVWDRAAMQAETAIEDRALRRFLRATIESAQPIALREGAREPRVLFMGGPDHLLAAAPLPSALAPPGPQLVGFGFETMTDGLALVLRWRTLGDDRPNFALPPEDGVEILARGLSRGAFGYVGADGVARDMWFGPELPDLVILTIGEDRPPLLVAPRLSAETGS